MAAKKSPVTETKSVSEARRTFSETLDQVREADLRVIVEKSGIPVAAIVPLTVLESAEERELRRQQALESFRRAQEGFAGVSEEEAEREIELALNEIKQERRIARRIVAVLVQEHPDLFVSSEDSLVSTVSRLLRDETAKMQASSNGGKGQRA